MTVGNDTAKEQIRSMQRLARELETWRAESRCIIHSANSAQANGTSDWSRPRDSFHPCLPW